MISIQRVTNSNHNKVCNMWVAAANFPPSSERASHWFILRIVKEVEANSRWSRLRDQEHIAGDESLWVGRSVSWLGDPSTMVEAFDGASSPFTWPVINLSVLHIPVCPWVADAACFSPLNNLPQTFWCEKSLTRSSAWASSSRAQWKPPRRLTRWSHCSDLWTDTDGTSWKKERRISRVRPSLLSWTA